MIWCLGARTPEAGRGFARPLRLECGRRSVFVDLDQLLILISGALGPGDGVATELIQAGKAGAIYIGYIGRMEYGPRPLGARSIIASPVDATINERLNRQLNRSEFMPFAPSVLEEDAERVFEMTAINRYAARFMTITCEARPEWRAFRRWCI